MGSASLGQAPVQSSTWNDVTDDNQTPPAQAVSDEETPKEEEDDLEIPAFLRSNR